MRIRGLPPIVLLCVVVCLSIFALPGNAASPACPESHAVVGYQFMRKLVKSSPTYPVNPDYPLRRYSLMDVDNDGCVEVLEGINDLEEQGPGLFNAELYPAFEWINIYSYAEGRYVMNTANYRSFLVVRKSFYGHWQRALDQEQVLDRYSRETVLRIMNKKVFEEKLRSYLTRVEAMLSENGRK